MATDRRRWPLDGRPGRSPKKRIPPHLSLTPFGVRWHNYRMSNSERSLHPGGCDDHDPIQ